MGGFYCTVTFMGKTHDIGGFERDYICLKMLWDSIMYTSLGCDSVVGEIFRQEVVLPWSGEVRAINSNAELMVVLDEFERRGEENIHLNVNYLPLQTIYPDEPNQQQAILPQPNQLHPNQPQALEDDVISIETNSCPNPDGSGSDFDNSDVPSSVDSENVGVKGSVGREEAASGGDQEAPDGDQDATYRDQPDESDCLSDINEDNISQERVEQVGSDSDSDAHTRVRVKGKTFRPTEDGQIVLEKGLLFRDMQHFRQVIVDYSIQEGFKLDRIKNERRRIIFGCQADRCGWRVHGSHSRDRLSYQLKTIKPTHSCLAVTRNTDVNYRWVGNKFQKMIKENPSITVKVLQTVVMNQTGVKVPLYTLYRAKTHALEVGTEAHKDSYNKLHRYGHVIREKDPGSSFFLNTIRYNPDPNVPSHFNRLFLSFNAQKLGFIEGCKSFIGLDGCHLKGPYQGILLCAVGIDANLGAFPLALGVCDIENTETWGWFLNLLYEHIGMHDSRVMCFMTDRQKGIPVALGGNWQCRFHSRFYGRHILANMMAKYRIDYLKDYFWAAARSPNSVEFLENMEQIKQTSVEAYTYLLKIPISYWSVHAFDRETKSDHMTNNIVETFNSWMNPFRAMPMLSMLETVRKKLMTRAHKRYCAAMTWQSDIPPRVKRALQMTQKLARYFNPLQSGEWSFEVADGNRQFVVELNKQSCDCGLWFVRGLPCKHAMACITKRRLAVEDYVHRYMKKEAYLRTYGHRISPIPDEHAWPDVQFQMVLPPMIKRRPERPKKSRTRGPTEPAKGEKSVGVRCSKCREVGHNRRTCKNKGAGTPSSSGTKRKYGSTSERATTSNMGTSERATASATASTHGHDVPTSQNLSQTAPVSSQIAEDAAGNL